MRLFQLIALVFFIFTSFHLCGQYQKNSQELALEFLENKKIEFKNAANDSTFIAQNSDSPFKKYTFSRGDQEVDLEDQIYSAAMGDVVGPFRGGDSMNYIFKIKSFEKYTLRSKAKLIYIKSNDDAKQDTASASKLTQKYFDYISKGKDIKSHAHKENVRLVFKDLNWFYECDPKPDYFQQVMSMKKGESMIINTPQGKAILQVTNSKENAPYTVKLYAVIKKG